MILTGVSRAEETRGQENQLNIVAQSTRKEIHACRFLWQEVFNV
jgi:hypothetical protein